MKVPIRWLNDFVKVDDIDIKELASYFFGIGFEVEEIINPSDAYANIVTGKIISLSKHPKADNLDIVSLDIGAGKTVTIVTGAKNIKAGDIVPAALDGAVVSGGKKISKTDFRGVFSEGMLCSGGELDIDDNTIEGAEANGILILPKGTEVGINIGKALDVDEYILDISVSSNRPDCNSIMGLAREIAAKLERPLKELPQTYKTHAQPALTLPKINIHDQNLCSRYFGNMIFDVQIQKSPRWLAKRLIAAGVRPINNVVDVTNYVLIETGQPLHAFDYQIIEGDINIRTASSGETIKALNDTEYKLSENMLLIADDAKPLAIAGVMGGEGSAISDKTGVVFLESARFAKLSVRSTSRSLGLRSESSARFERGVDYASVEKGKNRALNLIDTLKMGKISSEITFSQSPEQEQKQVKASSNKINSILGIKVSVAQIKSILKSLGFGIIDESGEDFTAIVPPWREDIDNFADLAEEVIRFYGYDKIVSTNMESASLTKGQIPTTFQNLRKIRSILCGAGLYEIINFSFIGPSDVQKLQIPDGDKLKTQIRIASPLGEDRAYMRTQLVSSMIKTLALNISRQNSDLALFEIAKVFIPKSLPLTDLPIEQNVLAIGLSGTGYDFYHLKSIVSNIFKAFSLPLKIERSQKSWLHPGISADIMLDGKAIGSFGKLHPITASGFEVDENIYILELILDDIIEREPEFATVSPLPKYPAVDRDLAVVVSQKTTVGELIASIKQAAGEMLEDIKLFDIYAGGQIEQGFKSVAFSLRFRNVQKTLQENDVTALMNAIITALTANQGAKLR